MSQPANFTDEVSNIPSVPDSETQKQLLQWGAHQKQQVKIDNIKQNIEERKKYADLIFQFTCFWCLFVGFILICCGVGTIYLSDLILTTLIGSTTLNVFGFFLLVTKYLFNETKST